MEDNKQSEIQGHVNSKWKDSSLKEQVKLAKQLENDYIFGKIASNEHYNIDELMKVVKQVDLEKNPPVIEQEIKAIDEE